MNDSLVRNVIAMDAAASAALPASGDADDIRDIRGPKAVPASWLFPALIGAALLLAVAAIVMWRWRRRVRRVRTLSLEEQTLLRLDAIRPLMQPASARAFGIAVSEIVRTYIENKFAVVATQRTTEEFLQGLLQSTDDPLSRHRPLLADFLQQTDFVKFAGVSLTSQNMESLFQSARNFVLETSQPPAA